MKHTLILGSTGLIVGGLSVFVGLPLMVETILWLIFYLLWVVYGVRVKRESPVRNMMFAGTLSGLLCATMKVLFMEQFKLNNPWAYTDAAAKELMIGFMGSGIGIGLIAGTIVGALVRWRLQQTQG
ncbi:MAG: hypothetical protein CL930_00615 [Deltaproteobacteria bacterium]|nr:hypothetical protein [Deltaproteobacteria bacterium]